ncbi:hypothetical protein NST02_20850 [Robertmurraya sp. FSL W8-0741]|uniref:Cas10/Cmr2 second palm domain-containing protein n=1 Tax=Robertmurraya sp. FSL W8-0741 TaxID=2954629 RepID=UPI0030F582E6
MMGQNVVAVSIDKVQTFLYYVLQAYIQENQANSGTLREIVNSSHLISEQFFQDIGIKGDGGEFSGHINNQLLVCSGMCIFTTSLEKELITEKLDRLFIKYYENYNGQLLVKFDTFEKELSTNSDKLKAIKESKERLRQKECLNYIIERNQDLLFQFCDVSKKNKLASSNVSIKKYSDFAFDINSLFSQEESSNENHFRIAVIKADLDGMGSLFEQIDEYRIYKEISHLLNNYISLDYLHKKIQAYKEVEQGFKLYPLYMAGDDIFFAISAAHLMTGVKLCKEILRKLNSEINKLNKLYSTNIQQLSMSIGIDFTFNREPIRYYYERVQSQVEKAKNYSSNIKKDIANYVKISINDNVFRDYDKCKSQWDYFRDDVAILKGAMKAGFATHHFLYGLLRKIELIIDSNDIKFSNTVLYHLLPEHLEGNNEKLRDYELLMIYTLLKKLLVEKESCSNGKNAEFKKNKNKGPEKKLSFELKQRKELIRYVRLLLLFSRITNDDISSPRIDKKKIRSTLFNKTMRYIYNESMFLSLKDKSLKEDIGEFRKNFAVFTCYEAPKRSSVQIYRTLQISRSMFYRFKNTYENKIEIAANMIHSLNARSKGEIKTLENQKKVEKKAPPVLFFDIEKFLYDAHHTNLWTDDYIDTLIIFYRLKELSIRYKVITSSNKK